MPRDGRKDFFARLRKKNMASFRFSEVSERRKIDGVRGGCARGKKNPENH